MDFTSHAILADRSQAVLAVTVSMVVLSFVFVLLRVVSRASIVKHISIDDYLMIAAWLIALAMSVSICLGTAWGLGRDEASIPSAWQPTLTRTNFAFEILYQPALMALKTSILAFYLTFSAAHRTFKWACVATLVVVNAGGFALTMVTVFQCDPVGAVLEFPVPDTAHCIDILTIFLSSAPLNLITDFAILFLPMPILTSMRLPRKQKIILIVTFSFGFFVAAVDVVRIAYLQNAAMTRLAEIQSQSGDSTRSAEATDFSHYASLSFMWSAVEVNVGIMCACVPGLKPLVARFVPHMLRDVGDETTRSVSIQNGTVGMTEAHRVPSAATMPDDVRPHDFATPTEAHEDGDGTMGMMDFLTTPDMVSAPNMHGLQRTETALTNTSRATAPPDTPTFFDFVNMNGQKSMVHMTNRESVFPIVMVTILFFIWGFEYGLIDVLNAQFQTVARYTPGQSTGIHSAYFAGYAAGPPLVGRLVLKHWGFKSCYSVGLGIFACGTLIYWPAAVLTSFPAFVLTNFIVAFGLSILEISANPFIALCGPAEYSEIRLNLSQGVQAVGSIVAPLIANRAFFHKSLNAPSLVSTQWAYLGISLATILLAVLYYYVPLPEATDQELEDASERMDGAYHAKIGNVGIVWITLALGVWSQFCYVGGQEVNATSFDTYLAQYNPALNESNYMAVAHTAFAASRFLAAGLGFWIKPRVLVLFFYAGAIIFQVLAMNYHGRTGVAMLIMAFFMEGPLFSLIFAQSLRGMGRHTKLASVFITAAVSGGAVFSPIASRLATSSRGSGYSLVVAVAAFAGGIVFAFELNGSAKARAQVDPIRDATTPPGSRPGSTSSRTSRALSFIVIGKKRSRASDDQAEYRERKPPDGQPTVQS